MVARLTVDEVLDEVLMDCDDDRLEDEVVEEGDRDREKLVELLEKFKGGDGFDGEFFKREAVDLLLPLVRLTSKIRKLKSSEADTRVNVAHVLSSHTITAGSVLDMEVRLWLKQIYRRLSGRVSVRRPYYAEIHRNIPYAVFNAMSVVIQQCPDMFKEPVCYSVKNKKGHVITFTTKGSLVLFFGLLTSLSGAEVEAFFERKLRGLKRNKHIVKLIVEDVKDFAFVYQHNKGSMTIQFHYGEWNTHAFQGKIYIY